MKRIQIVLLVGLLLLPMACVPKQTIDTGADQKAAADQLFERGQALAHREAYADALRAFESFMERYPDRPRAPDALMQSAGIYALLGDHEQALNAYDRLLKQYPDSPLATEAMSRSLESCFLVGNYPEVVRRAAALLARPISSKQVFRTYLILGDTHMAVGKPADSVYFYTLAFHKAEAPDRDTVVGKLKRAVLELQSDQIHELLARLDDDLPVGYLLYQLGLNEIEDKNYQEATQALAVFIDRFPAHEYHDEAVALLDELKTNYVFRPNTVGCLLPLSGPYRAYGQRALKGVELAMDQFRRLGAEPAPHLIVKDTGSDPVRAAAAVREFFEEKVAVIVGPIITAESAAEEAQGFGIPIIALSQKNGIPEIGDYVFRNFLTPRMQVEALVTHAIREMGFRRFAILYPDETYGRTFANLFWDNILTLDGELVGIESYSADQTDFADSIKKLVGLYYDIPEDLIRLDDTAGRVDDVEALFAEELIDVPLMEEMPEEETPTGRGEKEETPQPIVDFDAVFIPDAPTQAGLLVPQLAYYDINDVYLLGTNLWHSKKLVQMSGEFLRRAIVPDGFFLESTREPVPTFVRLFAETYEEQPGFIEAVAFDSASIAFEIMGGTDFEYRSVLRDELKHLRSYPGVTGETSFDETGEARKKLSLLRIRRGRFVEIKTR